MAAPSRLSVGSPLIRYRTPRGACSLATRAPSLPRSSPTTNSSADARLAVARAAARPPRPAPRGSPSRRTSRGRTPARAPRGSERTAGRSRSAWRTRPRAARPRRAKTLKRPSATGCSVDLIAALAQEPRQPARRLALAAGRRIDVDQAAGRARRDRRSRLEPSAPVSDGPVTARAAAPSSFSSCSTCMILSRAAGARRHHRQTIALLDAAPSPPSPPCTGIGFASTKFTWINGSSQWCSLRAPAKSPFSHSSTICTISAGASFDATEIDAAAADRHHRHRRADRRRSSSMKSSRRGRDDLAHLHDVAGRFLDRRRCCGISESRATVCDLQVDAGAARDVVEHDRQRRALGDRLVVLIQAFLRRLVVVRRHRQDAVGADALHARAPARSPRACRSRRRRPAPARGRPPLRPRARRRAASRGGSASALRPVVPQGETKWTPASICRRASRRTAASSSEPSLRERRDERGADAGEWSAHVHSILTLAKCTIAVRRPLQHVLHREPALRPWIQRAATARRPQTRGGRAPCGSARSYPTDRRNRSCACRESCRRAWTTCRSADRNPAPRHRVAQQQRRAGRRVALGGVVRLVDPGAVLRRAPASAARPRPP